MYVNSRNRKKRTKKQFFVLMTESGSHPKDVKNYAELNGYKDVTFIVPGLYLCTALGNQLPDIMVLNKVYL